MSYPSAPGLNNPWDGWLPEEAYEKGLKEGAELDEVQKLQTAILVVDSLPKSKHTADVLVRLVQRLAAERDE